MVSWDSCHLHPANPPDTSRSECITGFQVFTDTRVVALAIITSLSRISPCFGRHDDRRSTSYPLPGLTSQKLIAPRGYYIAGMYGYERMVAETGILALGVLIAR